MKNNFRTARGLMPARFIVTFATGLLAAAVLSLPAFDHAGLAPRASANSVYFNMSTGTMNFGVSAANAGQITVNDDWSGVASVEGYKGLNLTATHGIDPQTVLNTEFANDQLPNTPTNVAANKGNPSAFNAGGLAEFDAGTFLAVGMQGNVQANPYLVFYLNTTGRTGVTVNYQVQDIDTGSNDSVSMLALQYRVGETGPFTNVPAGFIADATDGGVAGRITTRSVMLPVFATNQPKVQVRLITTNAAGTNGNSSPDEWMGVNNIALSSSVISAAGAQVSGRVTTANGLGIKGAYVTIDDLAGASKTVMTSAFGYYSFSDVTVGSTYLVSIKSKRFTFLSNPRVVSVLADLADQDFVAD